MAVTVNKQEMAHRLGKSLPTLTRWLLRYGADFPVVTRGTNGRSYEFDVAAVFDFLRRKQEEQAQAEGEKDEELAQLILPFVVPGADQPAAGSAKEMLDVMRLRRMQREEAEKAGLLVPAQAVADTFSTCLARLSRNTHAFIRQIGREQNWPASYVQELERRLAEVQRGSVKAAEEMLGEPREGGEDEQQLAFA